MGEVLEITGFNHQQCWVGGEGKTCSMTQRTGPGPTSTTKQLQDLRPATSPPWAFMCAHEQNSPTPAAGRQGRRGRLVPVLGLLEERGSLRPSTECITGLSPPGRPLGMHLATWAINSCVSWSLSRASCVQMGSGRQCQ